MSVSNEALLDELKTEIIALLQRKYFDVQEFIVQNTKDRDSLEYYNALEKRIPEALRESQIKDLSWKAVEDASKELLKTLTKEACEALKGNIERQLSSLDNMQRAGQRAVAPSEERKTQLDQEHMENPITNDFITDHPILGLLMKTVELVGSGFSWMASPFKAFGSWAANRFKNPFSTNKNKKQEGSLELHDVNVDSSLDTSALREKVEDLGSELKSIVEKNANPLISDRPEVVIHTSLDPISPQDSTQAGSPVPNTEADKPNKGSNPTV